ncbi:MAG TPA: choice-of-anchor tandem repeat GloVer-containing protein [Terriglobales bacterium]|nr:choice-of-anchor tandem repeat GloVer-containing protein [Terriglobales bacterium]
MRRLLCGYTLVICVAAVVSGAAKFGFSQAGQETVLYSFCADTNCTDGAAPHGKLTFDAAGNLYGTTAGGGNNCQQTGGCGTVFELSPSSNGAWVESVLYSFGATSIDGATPMAAVILDKAGNLYGTTEQGGTYGLGTVFQLNPPSGQGESWTETVLWSFGATGDGRSPLCDLTFDGSGRLYGTTAGGGTSNGGTVFRLVPGAGGQWSEEILYSFGPGTAGGFGPEAAVSFDSSGNLYGTTVEGGSSGLGLGVVYRLSPNPEPPWTETVLHKFEGEGNPYSTVSFDSAGNMYGTFTGVGGVFRITPQGGYRQLLFDGPPGPSIPYAGVFVHSKTLYGTTAAGGTQDLGSVFEIHGTTSTVLYSFGSQPGSADGAIPESAVIGRGASLYGTTTGGGVNGGWGVVFQISSSELRTQPKGTGR